MLFSRGQSLIETLVALTILIIGILGAVSLSIYTIRAGASSKDDIIAENLAREGIEAVRWLRDDNWVKEAGWNKGLDKPDEYRILLGDLGNPGDSVDLQKSKEGEISIEHPFYRLCLLDGQYQHMKDGEKECLGKWQDSVFNRRITLDRISADEIRVVSEVKRGGAWGAKVYTLTEHIYNWL